MEVISKIPRKILTTEKQLQQPKKPFSAKQAKGEISKD